MQNKFKDIVRCVIRTETTMSETDNNDKTIGPTDPVSRLTGRVKWFNNKTGFGFITALTDSEGVKEGSDVFVHHSAVKVSQEQYRYLVQGEYVEFVLSKLVNADAAASKHEFQAVDVSGVKGGKLICETRWESRSTAGSGAGFSGSGSGSGASRFNRSNEGSGSGAGFGAGTGTGTGSSEWTTVGGPRKSSSFVPRQGSTEWRRGESSGRGRGRGGRGGVHIE
jgi:cold shock CspA family protein